MFAYTATFGGGFSATIDFEQPENVANYAYSTTSNNASLLGARSPDIIASLDVTQAWGMAHLAAVAHNVRMQAGDGWSSNSINTWGWGVIGGLGINLPSLGAGDVLKLQADYTHAAVSYSGFVTDNWGENNQGMNMNGNGNLYQFADAYFSGLNGWSLPTTWGAAATLELHVSPQFEIAPEIAYGQISWSNAGVSQEGSAYSWMGGAVFELDSGRPISASTSTCSISTRIWTLLCIMVLAAPSSRAALSTPSTAASASSATSDRDLNRVTKWTPERKLRGFLFLGVADYRDCSSDNRSRHSMLRFD